ncbi:hypothetical protein GGI07_004925 [Coemansia sp. Benny D115]|nr:hypothetical protein GGI07_004925 [Coemansia sp. Benny D115]
MPVAITTTPTTTPASAAVATVSPVGAVLFDLDGTLIETLEVTEQVYRECALEHGIDPRPVLEFCHGVPTLHVLRQCFPPVTHTEEYALEIERRAGRLLQGLKTIPGARELLDSLQDSWAIFTSGMPFLAVPRMQHLKLTVPRVFITPVDIVHGKPNPEGYLLAAKRMGKDPVDCVVFEDAVAGVRAGKESGALVIGVRTLLSAEELKSAGAALTVRDMTAVQATRGPDGLLTLTIDES